MELKDIRQKRLKEWFADKKLPPKDASFISQVIGGKFIGERAARRLENDHGMPALYLDQPYNGEESEEKTKPDETQHTEHGAARYDYRLSKALSLLNSLPDDESDAFLDQFLSRLIERNEYYEERFREYVRKNKLKDI
ncbi:hypothetical protein VBR58_000810 [Citrobacter freundii]|nr:hypothetical protein [Citrobacter freundii]ELJ9990414.1 hypothetical protein [Citrobacter freundii]EMC0438025.1 hypothetical protein [Citrobacter freundii]EMD0452283.1 hypothetical protein [Citrobacter freundii]